MREYMMVAKIESDDAGDTESLFSNVSSATLSTSGAAVKRVFPFDEAV